MKPEIKLALFFLMGLLNSINAELPLKNLTLSGELRFRQIYYQSESSVPSYLEGSGKKEVSYGDLFFRNRLNFQVSPILQIGSVFDVYSVFGEGKGEISSSDIGLQARNVFAELKLFKTAKLTGGYTTFTLPKGFVLATNGAGIKYEHSLFDDLLVPYFSWIKAYDNSRNIMNNGIGLNEYKDNDIFIGGIKLNPSEVVNNVDFFYVYDYDRESQIDPVKYLYWAGLTSQLILQNINLDIAFIYNSGKYFIHDNFEPVSSYLFFLSMSYEKNFDQSKLKFSGTLEGASGKPGQVYRPDQFMSINPSYGINNISLDNSAGISIFRGGNFSGLVNISLIADYSIKELNIKFIYSRLRLYNLILSSKSAFGNEADLNILYGFNKNMYLNIQSGIFFPEIAYSLVSQNQVQNPVMEITAGISIKY
ncbi:MAG: hypothetical protein OEV66_11615 [Spirochaetia bacterium]|nr:hypothetical protein [Spirochaetia bacterium]